MRQRHDSSKMNRKKHMTQKTNNRAFVPYPDNIRCKQSIRIWASTCNNIDSCFSTVWNQNSRKSSVLQNYLQKYSGNSTADYNWTKSNILLFYNIYVFLYTIQIIIQSKTTIMMIFILKIKGERQFT